MAATNTENMNDAVVGIIGMGDMGKIIHACDIPSKYEALKEEFGDKSNITIFPNGHLVSRSSDYIIYSVEAGLMDQVVAEYGPSTKVGAIVGGQTSCKDPEMRAFAAHLPSDVEIVSCHSLHGPKVDPRGQPLVLIKERASDKSFNLVTRILSPLHSTPVHLTSKQHDRITADTQAVTHAAFLSMGCAWRANNQFPWQIPRYVGGIENVKINVMMRIYSNKWHVYAGLAILNPAAKEQIQQYAQSVTELFKLMLEGNKTELERRVRAAGDMVFKGREGEEMLLKDDLLDQFSLGKIPPTEGRVRNNHLSLLGIVDCWSQLGIIPFDHMICSTPLFRLWLGVTEYLFRTPRLLSEALDTAISDTSFRSDDLEFTFAARGWSDTVRFGSFEAYRDRFESVQAYFAPQFPEATRVGNAMIRTILEHTSQKNVSVGDVRGE
ncbi:MAG: prephenate dehydrogenase (NADP(+)) [Cirrosporium novae-zelandiae]|nr:MAG: prephenate dehydrogenase (NADP(+)) [Cirrosporium novae-zelandiae]